MILAPSCIIHPKLSVEMESLQSYRWTKTSKSTSLVREVAFHIVISNMSEHFTVMKVSAVALFAVYCTLLFSKFFYSYSVQSTKQIILFAR